MNIKIKITCILLLIILLTACSESKFDIVGMWQDADGTIRTFNYDSTCNAIALIDIGGPSPTYNLSEKVNSEGYYVLYVIQGGYNQTIFHVKVINENEILIFDNIGDETPRYTLTRL